MFNLFLFVSITCFSLFVLVVSFSPKLFFLVWVCPSTFLFFSVYDKI